MWKSDSRVQHQLSTGIPGAMGGSAPPALQGIPCLLRSFPCFTWSRSASNSPVSSVFICKLNTRRKGENGVT